MASSSLTVPYLHTQLRPSNTLTAIRRPSTSLQISASISEKPPIQPESPEIPTLPLRKIPGSYGLPVLGAISDRQDYFYNQGRDEFFKSRSQKYKSTVFRANMPPGPFIAQNSRVIVVLDGRSFPVLFDTSKVEKRDLFTGTFMPSVDLTGGYRILSYLDPSEPNHAKLKSLLFFLLKSRREKIIPEFQSTFAAMFESLETELAAKGKANFGEASDQASFTFLARALYGSNPADTKLGLDGPALVQKWVLFQISPILSLGLPKLLEELTIHSFRLPAFLVKSDYERLYAFFRDSGGEILGEAERLGLSKDEACHNLLFATCFNSFGGMKILFPSIVKLIGRAGVKVHTRLAAEIREVVRSNGGRVTMGGMEQMALMKSVVYECLRIEPPVPLQYGKAKKDFAIQSHDASFQVREGEMIFGYQPFATKDPLIFHRPEEFVPDRFVGDDGERLLRHVLWSNGPESESPTVGNKQCAGKDFVVLVARLLVVEFFMRYDSFEIELGTSPLGAAITITSLKRATF